MTNHYSDLGSTVFGRRYYPRLRFGSCLVAPAVLFLVTMLFLVPLPARSSASEALPGQFADHFVHPPAWARPSCFWWWFNSLVDKEGITRDLEEFKARGMGGVTLVCTGNDYGVEPMPRGPVFLSPEWRALFRYALEEADRLGLEVGVNFCGGGWCMGGAWMKPELSARWFVQSQTNVTGPAVFSGRLPMPGYRDGYMPPHYGNVSHYMTWPEAKADYRDSAVVAFLEPNGGHADLGPARGALLAAKSNRKDASCGTTVSAIMDPPAVAWTNEPSDTPINPATVVNLTSRLKPDGSLEWNVPPGRWTILRTGHVATGADVRCVLPEVGYVLEIDWLNPDAVDEMFTHLGSVLLEEAGPLAGKTLKFLHTDSFEDGFPNWTGRLLQEFKKNRGYDPAPYLPVLAGKIIGSAVISDRFLYDYRRTVADCMADGSYGHFARRAREHGLEIQCEAAGPAWSQTMCMDALKNLGRCDRPMGEFWQDGIMVEANQNFVGKQTASAAHIYGRRTASAEAFTSFRPHWSDGPPSLKPTADRAFCEGINRFVFHTMTSTRPQDGLPGYEYGAGTHFNPNVTWWQIGAGPWLDYVNRCQVLLQSGKFVADVLFYNGDGAPNFVQPKRVIPSLGRGYDYDVCNTEVLLTRLSVENGRLLLPDGMTYRLLVLPDSSRMPVAVIRRLRELVRAGATVVGPRPETAPGLTDYPHCDDVVKNAARDLWGEIDGHTVQEHKSGKGLVIHGRSLRSILEQQGVAPDFEVVGQDNPFIDYLHRVAPGIEIYFLANRLNRPETLEAFFRVSGMQPELWDPVTGAMRDLPAWTVKAGRTSVPLVFEPHGSMFIVFRKPAQPAINAPSLVNFLKTEHRLDLAGSWTVQFSQSWFYPTQGLTGDAADGKLLFETLQDWSTRPESAVKYFSGTALYTKQFDFDKSQSGDPNARTFLDLGSVKEIARVRLNGKPLGVLWCAPWRVETTGALQPGRNELQVEVVNFWPNRLIGDALLPAEARRTRTNVRTERNAPLLPSGLLGPVSIRCTATVSP